jgi:hypothetical protein
MPHHRLLTLILTIVLPTIGSQELILSPRALPIDQIPQQKRAPNFLRALFMRKELLRPSGSGEA